MTARKLGANWIAPQSLSLIQALFRQKRIQFCEIMVDNFIHLPAWKIQAVLPNIPVAFHIVASRFLEKSPEELQLLATKLRDWISILKPIYISDHLIQHTDSNGSQLAMIAELNYASDYAHIKKRVQEWQTLLGTKIYFENHASLTSAGYDQVEFFANLITDAGAGLLFDFSNAYIAECNHVRPVSAWEKLIKTTSHFHVAGFRLDKQSQLFLDTHDRPIDNEVLTLISHYLKNNSQFNLVIECNAESIESNYEKEITRIEAALNSPSIPEQTFNANHKKPTPKIHDSLVLQNMHHRMFQFTPTLFSQLSAESFSLITSFLQWCDQEKLKLSWNMHIYFLYWLKQHEWNFLLNEENIRELLVACATRWLFQGCSHADAQGLILAVPELPRIAIGLWKSQSSADGPKVVLIELDSKLHPHQASYAISYQHGSWENIQWEAAL